MLVPRLRYAKNGSNPAFEGITTFHFSIRPNIGKPLDLNYLYNLGVGMPHTWKLTVGNNGYHVKENKNLDYLRLETGDGTIYHQTKWGKDTWYNYAITTNWVKK